MIGDPLEVQKIHVLKSPTSGHNNKICQKRFGLLLLPPFLPITMVCSENKKWFFSQKNHFLFTERAILVSRKGRSSNNPKRFWYILLLCPDVGDFKTWLFCTSIGFLMTPWQSFSWRLTFYSNPFWDTVFNFHKFFHSFRSFFYYYFFCLLEHKSSKLKV